MNKQSSNLKGMSAIAASVSILVALIVGFVIWKFILGAPGNFDAEGHPKNGNILGMMFKGGFIVPILLCILITIITFSVERLMTIMRASGSGNSAEFVRKIKSMLSGNQLDEAIAECDKQQGSLANVVRAGVDKLKNIQNDGNLDKESKVAAIQKELEEATSLELPMLSKNMVILSTCATIATLFGLIGTVIGMIRSFAALSQAGAPDTTALATGISEALINTAFGIISSVLGIIMYNIFTTKIDSLTYSMDEAGFSIVQSVSAHK
jgi:biopolymer transport protein ExbB